MLYFDSAATTLQKPASVAGAVARAIAGMTTPGRGDYPASRRAADMVLALRTEAAEYFGVSEPENVVLTNSATHGLNIAIKSLVSPGDKVLISGYEHNAVTRPLRAIGDVSVWVAQAPPFAPDRMAEAFEKYLRQGVKAAVCTQMSNVYGCVLPVDDIAAMCRRQGVPLIIDASQSAGMLPVDLGRWGAAFVAMPGHKGLYGPQGTGLLLCGDGSLPKPLLEGGTGSLSQLQDMPDFLPDRLEAGTHNVHGAAGLLEGLRFVRRFVPGELARHESGLMAMLAKGLREKGTYRVCAPEGAETSVLSVQPLDREPEELADELARRDVAVRAGLHCAPLAHLTGGTGERGTVRFSASAFNTPAEVEALLDLL